MKPSILRISLFFGLFLLAFLFNPCLTSSQSKAAFIASSAPVSLDRIKDLPFYALPPKPPRELAKLESLLYQLIKAPDRSQFAREHRLYLSEDGVRVIIELIPDCPKIEKDYRMVVEGKVNNLIKALVPVDELILLTKDPCIRFIRSPHLPIPHPPKAERKGNQLL